MTDGIGRAMLRGTIASVAGIAAMNLYFTTMENLRKRAESRAETDAGETDAGEARPAGASAEGGRPERAEATARGPATAAAPGGGPTDDPQEPRSWHVEDHRAVSQPGNGALRDHGEAAVGAGGGRREAAGPEEERGAPDGGARGDGELRHALDDISLVGQVHRDGEPATVAVGRVLYEKLRGRELPSDRRDRVGTFVHWGYGMAVGSLYGLLDRKMRNHDVSAGLGYGAALWLFGDELAVPMLGLAEGPTAHPPRVHAEALGAHLVYGATTSMANRALKRFV